MPASHKMQDVALLLAVGVERLKPALAGSAATQGLGAEVSPASRTKQSDRQRPGAAKGGASDSLRRSGRQRRPSRHGPSASPQPRAASSSACTPGARKAPGQRAGMASLRGAQPPQHTSGLSGTVPATPKRQETTAVQRGTWTHVGTPPHQGQAAGLERCGAAACTRRSKVSELCNLAPAVSSAPAQPLPPAAAAPVSDAPTSAEASQRAPALGASITGKPALRAAAALKELTPQALSLPSAQAIAATHAVAAAELSLASQPTAATGTATDPPVLSAAGLALSARSGQASQQLAGIAAEDGPSFWGPQLAASAQPHLADETCSAEICMAVTSGSAAQLPQQQAPDMPTEALLQVSDMHAAVLAQPDAEQLSSEKGTMEPHCYEPVQETEQQAAERPPEGAQGMPDVHAKAAAQHDAEQSPSADNVSVLEADAAVEKPEPQGACLPAEQPHQAEPVRISEAPACLSPRPALVGETAQLAPDVNEAANNLRAETASSGRLMLSQRSDKRQPRTNEEPSKSPLRALPESFTAQLPASAKIERTFSRRRSVVLSDRSASKGRPPSGSQSAEEARPGKGRPELAPGVETLATLSPLQRTECPSDAAPSAPIPDSAPMHGAQSKLADRAAPASPESQSAPALQPKGPAREGSAAASQLQERPQRPRDTARGKSSGRPTAKRMQSRIPGKRTSAAAGARTAAGRQQAVKGGLGCSRCRFAQKGCLTCRQKPAAAVRQEAAEQASKPTIAPAQALAAQPMPELHLKVGKRADQACGY